MILNSPASAGVLDFDPYSVRAVADPSMNLGSYIELADFRAFRYARAGGANTGAGKLETAPAVAANHANMSVLAAGIGATTLTVTPGATAGVNSQYDEGLLAVNAGPGAGQVFKVSHNPAFASATAFNLLLNDQVITPLTASSKVSLVANQHNGVVESTDATRRACGVGLVGLQANYYGWLQVKGVVAALAQGAIPIGSDICASASVAGAIRAVDTTSAATVAAQVKIGDADVVAGVDTEYRPVVINID